MIYGAVDLGAYEYAGPYFDHDNDGLPNQWEEGFFGGDVAAERTANPDQDAFDNWEEYIAGTDPTNAASSFVVQSAEKTAEKTADGFVMRWESVSNRVYAIYRANEPGGSYQAIATDLAFPAHSYTDSVDRAETAGFYALETRLAE